MEKIKLWDNIIFDVTVNTVQSVQVYIQSGDRTWEKCEYGIILHLEIQLVSFKVCTCICRVIGNRIWGIYIFPQIMYI